LRGSACVQCRWWRDAAHAARPQTSTARLFSGCFYCRRGGLAECDPPMGHLPRRRSPAAPSVFPRPAVPRDESA
jgi:hypothetical protein